MAAVPAGRFVPLAVQLAGDSLGSLMVGAGRNRTPWVRHAGVGVEFAGAVGGFALLGWWIDRHYDTWPWALVICAFLGLFGATYNLIRESLAAFKQAEADDDARRRSSGVEGEADDETRRSPEE